MARRFRSNQPDMVTNLFLTIGQALWLLVSWPFRRRPAPLNQEAYRDHWERIHELLHDRGEQHWKQAVLEGDKLVDQALRELLIPGITFGDRLRAAEFRFNRDLYQHLWIAHKLRNQIAHEVGFSLVKQDAEGATAAFGDALRSLGAL